MAKLGKVTTTQGKVVWQIDCYDPRGKRVKKRFPKKADGEAYLGKVVASIKEDRYKDISDKKKASLTTFNELADRYGDACKYEKSCADFKGKIIPLLRATFGLEPLSQITYLDLETFRNQRRGISRFGKPRSHARINRELAVLRHMMTKAVTWGLLQSSPFKSGEKLFLKEDNRRLRFLAEEDIPRLLDKCSSYIRPIVKLAINTGIRRGELLGLRWEQIVNGFIYLDVADTKTAKPRHIPINAQAHTALKERRGENHLKSPYVFCDATGEPWKEIKDGFKNACRRAGIMDCRFHDLRHTYASHLVMRRVGLKTVADLLGHANIQMTMRYAHLAPGHSQDAVGQLDNLGIDGKLMGNFAPNQVFGKPQYEGNTLI